MALPDRAGEQAGVEILLFTMLACFTGAFTRVLIKKLPFDMPYTVVLFLLGFLWGMIPADQGGSLGVSSSNVSVIGPRFFLNVFLPSLIFFGAFEMKWYMFRNSMGQILLLAIPGVCISMALTAVVVKAMLEDQWSWAQCFLLGAVLAATDPVAVVSLMRANHAPIQVVTVMEGESLVNDGVAMVAFEVCLHLVTHGSASGGFVVGQICQLSFGALAIGVAWGFATVWILGRIQTDALVEVTVTFTSAYLLFYTAEYQCEFSGILAVVVYGMSYPAYGKTRFSPGMGKVVEEFLSIICFLSETVIFVLAGVLVWTRVDFHRITGADYGRALLLWLMLMVVRLLMLTILSPLLTRTGNGFGPRRALVFTWGGLRGAVALALALDLHMEEDLDDEVGRKMLFYTAAVTILTLVINAPLAAPLLRWSSKQRDEDEMAAEREQFKRGVDALSHRTNAHLASLKNLAECQNSNWEKVANFTYHGADSTLRNRLPRKVSFSTTPGLGGGTLPTFNNRDMAMKAGRLLFLRAVKKNYADQVGKGSLRWSSGQTLTYVADALEDTVCKTGASHLLARSPGSTGRLSMVPEPNSVTSVGGSAAGAVAIDVVKYLHNPKYLGWLKKRVTCGPLATIVDIIAVSELGDTVNALDGLRTAYLHGIEMVKEECAASEADVIVAEAKETWNNAQKILDNIERKYPAQLAQIRSTSAAMRVLAFQLDELEARASAFTGETHEKVVDVILKKQHKLIHNRAEFAGGFQQLNGGQSASALPAGQGSMARGQGSLGVLSPAPIQRRSSGPGSLDESFELNTVQNSHV